MKQRYLLAMLFMLPFTGPCFAQVADSTAIIGAFAKCWRPFSHEYSTIYALDEDEIKRYSKQKVCFTRDSINVHYGTFYTPRYSIKNVNAEKYAKDNFDCNKRKLGIIVDSIFEITISSVTKPSKEGKTHKMTDIVAFDGECIYMVVDGVIFKMLDADARAKPTTSN